MTLSVTCSTTVAAPPEQVFQAWTNADALRAWFAEHVDLGRPDEANASAYAQPREGAPFRFWGRRTLGCATDVQATQTITHIAHPDSLAFSWTLHGVPTDVRVTLSPAKSGTKVSIEHALQASLGVQREKQYVDDFWRFSLGNLSAFLSGGSDIDRIDPCSDEPVTIRLTQHVHASRSDVYRALIEPSLVNQWLFTSEAKIEPHTDGRYSLGWKYQIDGRDVVGGPTKILDMQRDEHLVLDWPDWRGDPDVPDQRIAFSLSDQTSGATRVDFVHDGFTRAVDVSDFPFGWREFLRGLARVAESVGTAAGQ